MPHMFKVKKLKWGMVSNGVTRITEWSVRSGRWGGLTLGPHPTLCLGRERPPGQLSWL